MSEYSLAELRAIAHESATTAVRATLLTLGIDADDPIQAQEDFAVLREVGKLVRDPEFRKDIEHTRAWRLALREIKTKGILTAVGVVVTGGLALLWLGIQARFGFGGH
jgi:hypothetical protein